MSTNGPEKRSFECIEVDDFKRLADLALGDLSNLFSRKPELGRIYQKRLLALTLCQGAAEHYVSGKRGINDFDVWAFFHSYQNVRFPYRRRGTVDFGESRFGANPDDPGYQGRRVDVIGRDIPCKSGEDAITAIRRYLATNKAKSPRLLAERPVILIWPDSRVGEVIWDPARDHRPDWHHRGTGALE